MSRALIVFPGDSAEPILGAIAGISKTIRVKMFIFSEPRKGRRVVYGTTECPVHSAATTLPV